MLYKSLDRQNYLESLSISPVVLQDFLRTQHCRGPGIMTLHEDLMSLTAQNPPKSTP
jgi:hypothetical protein